MMILLFLISLELTGPVGCALPVGDRIVVSMIQDHEVLMLDQSLNVIARFGEYGQGPKSLNRPYGVFHGTDGIWLYNLGSGFITVLDHNLEYIRRFRAEAIPVTQSARDPTWFAGIGWNEIWRSYRSGSSGFQSQDQGGAFSKANQAINNMFHYHFITIFGNGKVMWADSLDRMIRMDGKTILEVDETARQPKLKADPEWLLGVMDRLDHFPRPGFTYTDGDQEMAVVVVQNADKQDGAWRTFLIDQNGQVQSAIRGNDYPLCKSGELFLWCNDDRLLLDVWNFYSERPDQ